MNCKDLGSTVFIYLVSCLREVWGYLVIYIVNVLSFVLVVL
jgi:hypothetical protein